jgi:hypothetical protein
MGHPKHAWRIALAHDLIGRLQAARLNNVRDVCVHAFDALRPYLRVPEQRGEALGIVAAMGSKLLRRDVMPSEVAALAVTLMRQADVEEQDLGMRPHDERRAPAYAKERGP